MRHRFPIINTIEDVLPHIKDHEEFIVIDKGDYKVIDYVMQSSATFPYIDTAPLRDDYIKLAETAKILRECRGLIFDKEGKLISRPFQKFFNYGEKPDEQKDLELPHLVLEKLDGSMIRPLVIDGNIRFATRKGITDVAMQAETFAAGKENYITFISAWVNTGWTPIFEWCSRKNQVVIDHPEDKLVLLAVRKNDTGEYVNYDVLKRIAEQYEIPIVGNILGLNIADNTDFTPEQWKEQAAKLTDKEGYVMCWANGHMMKAKAEWYVTLHKAKEAIGREKDLIKAYLTTGVDDILPILPENYRQEVAHFLAKMTEEIITTCQRLDGIFVNIINKLPETFTRKDFALEVMKLAPKYKPFMFSLLPGRPCIEVVIPVLIRACSNRKALDEYRWLIGGIRYGEKEEEAA